MKLIFLAILALITKAIADISFYRPLENQLISGESGKADISIGWVESNDGPPINTFTNYTFTLLTGPNYNISIVSLLASNVTSSKFSNRTFEARINQNLCDDGLYYVQLVTGNKTSHSIHYTNRFQLTNMSGPSFDHGLMELPPDAYTSLSGQTQTSTKDISKYFTIPYNQQTGIARYAPMQSQPGSKNNLSTWSQRYPASSFSVFKTAGAITPDVSYTITQPMNYQIYTTVNYASYGVQPSEASWYPASRRIVKPFSEDKSSSTTFYTPIRIETSTSTST